MRKGREQERKEKRWELNPFDRRFRVEDDDVRVEEDPSHLREQRKKVSFEKIRRAQSTESETKERRNETNSHFVHFLSMC